MNRRGFTIVELLIVIVVIAILAAVTIVAYNGISNRAKASAAQSAAAQVTKKVLTYSIDNSDQYPSDLASIGIADSGGTSYQYSVNNSVSPRTYCVTATTNGVSYYESDATANPTAGACAGHGVDGVPAITNQAINPSLETTTSGWGGYGNAPGLLRVNTIAQSGSYSYRIAPTGAGFNGSQQLMSGLTAGAEYTGSAWFNRNAGTAGAQLAIEWRNAGGIVGSSSNSASLSATTGTWQRLTVTGTAPATSDRAYLITRYTSGVANVDIMFVDSMMFTTGPAVPSYADGTSPNWVWNGTVQNSTSTGPAF